MQGSFANCLKKNNLKNYFKCKAILQTAWKRTGKKDSVKNLTILIFIIRIKKISVSFF